MVAGQRWERHRLQPPPGLPLEVRELRRDARLLLFVTRARFREGEPPWELADRLAAAALDQGLTVRTRRVAAQLLAKLRRLATERGLPAPGDPPTTPS